MGTHKVLILSLKARSCFQASVSVPPVTVSFIIFIKPSVPHLLHLDSRLPSSSLAFQSPDRHPGRNERYNEPHDQHAPSRPLDLTLWRVHVFRIYSFRHFAGPGFQVEGAIVVGASIAVVVYGPRVKVRGACVGGESVYEGN